MGDYKGGKLNGSKVLRMLALYDHILGNDPPLKPRKGYTQTRELLNRADTLLSAGKQPKYSDKRSLVFLEYFRHIEQFRGAPSRALKTKQTKEIEETVMVDLGEGPVRVKKSVFDDMQKKRLDTDRKEMV